MAKITSDMKIEYATPEQAEWMRRLPCLGDDPELLAALSRVSEEEGSASDTQTLERRQRDWAVVEAAMDRARILHPRAYGLPD